jgi:hypothetical protein
MDLILLLPVSLIITAIVMKVIIFIITIGFHLTSMFVIRKAGSSKRVEQVGSSCEFGIEPSGFMKCWETIEWPNI